MTGGKGDVVFVGERGSSTSKMTESWSDKQASVMFGLKTGIPDN